MLRSAILLAVFVAVAAASAATKPYNQYGGGPPPPPPPPPPSPQLDALIKKYSGMQNTTCAQVNPHIPALSSDDVTAFLNAYKAFNGSNDETPVWDAAKKILSASDVQAFLSLPDSFATGGLDATMVLCSVLFQATPVRLAGFAVQGSAEEALVDKMLGDTMMMRDMLVAGGPVDNLYGEAYAIYTKLQQTSPILARTPKPVDDGTPWDDRNQSTIIHRLALGTALAHAAPLPYRYKPSPNDTTVDPVERYMHFEKAYLAGDLDPAFEVLTVFECRWAVDVDATSDDLLWMRTTLANYRPDEIAMDYSWRYSRAVRTEVAYGDPQCEELPGICTGTYAQIPAADGECGPRAFFGRFARQSFGLPTWGVTQPGHAAMTCWSPDGWHVLLGADWSFSWWGNRGGEDFFLETQCRELRPDYQKFLRGSWVANALGEEPVDPSWGPRNPSSYGQGGVWNALMLYSKKIAVNTTTAPTRPVGPSIVPTKVQALIDRWPQPVPTPNITTGPDGTITIPAAAYSFKNRSASMDTMKSFNEGEGLQVIHNGGDYVDPDAVSFGYTVTADAARTYYLTANFSTWHMNTAVMVSTNTTTTPMQLPVFYSLGYWNETQPLEINMLEGANFIKFSRRSTREIVFKEFFLYTTKPNIPAPPGNYTPQPIPPPSDYIEVAADTTCIKQGITDVPEKYCDLACQSLGLTYTGAKPRMNQTGCFALSSGQYKGNCNYNSNSSATVCTDPPCTVFGDVTQQLCVRK